MPLPEPGARPPAIGAGQGALQKRALAPILVGLASVVEPSAEVVVTEDAACAHPTVDREVDRAKLVAAASVHGEVLGRIGRPSLGVGELAAAVVAQPKAQYSVAVRQVVDVCRDRSGMVARRPSTAHPITQRDRRTLYPFIAEPPRLRP